MDFGTISSFITNIPVDWFILGGLAAFFSFDALRSGPGRVSALALAFPLTMVITSVLPKAFLLGSMTSQFSTPFLQGMLFLALLAAFYLLVRRMDASYGGEGQPLQALLTGCAGVAVFAVVWLQVPGLTGVWDFGTSVESVFAGAYSFWWLLGSYTTLAFIRS